MTYRPIAACVFAASLFAGASAANSATLQLVTPISVNYVENADFTVFDDSGTGDVTAAVQALPGLSTGCQASDYAGFAAFTIALIERGICSFADKVANAEAAGAYGVIVYNSQTGLLTGTLNSLATSIPSFFTTQDIGVSLRATPDAVVRMAYAGEPPAIPTPAALPLALTAFGGLVFLRRRRAAK